MIIKRTLKNYYTKVESDAIIGESLENSTSERFNIVENTHKNDTTNINSRIDELGSFNKCFFY